MHIIALRGNKELPRRLYLYYIDVVWCILKCKGVPGGEVQCGKYAAEECQPVRAAVRQQAGRYGPLQHTRTPATRARGGEASRNESLSSGAGVRAWGCRHSCTVLHTSRPPPPRHVTPPIPHLTSPHLPPYNRLR